MENAGHEHRIRLTLNVDVKGIEAELRQAFPSLRLQAQGENTCVLASPVKVPLSPILHYLDARGVSVFEAREMRPTLEDVFVKVTGMEAGRLQKEKESGK